jgi:RNA polymerase sigma-70 factor, ECF subfamily
MDALDQTIESHQHQIYATAYCLLGDRADAEDVTQEVLVRLWKNHGKLDRNRLKAWLIRVTRNACIDVIRRRKRDAEVVHRDASAQSVDAVPSDCAGAHVSLELSERGSRVAAGLRALSEPYRSIVVLREIQGMTYEEVGQALDLPVNTVKVYLHRGRRRLRDALREASTHEES